MSSTNSTEVVPLTTSRPVNGSSTDSSSTQSWMDGNSTTISIQNLVNGSTTAPTTMEGFHNHSSNWTWLSPYDNWPWNNSISIQTTNNVSAGNSANYYFFYSYYYYFIVFLLIFAALMIARVGLRRRQEVQRQAAIIRLRARRQQELNVANNELGINGMSTSGTDAKLSDLPPAYDDVVKAYMNAKDQLEAAEEGAVGGLTNSTAVSTLTIETDVDERNDSATVTTITTTTSVVAGSSNESVHGPPTYEDAAKNYTTQS